MQDSDTIEPLPDLSEASNEEVEQAKIGFVLVLANQYMDVGFVFCRNVPLWCEHESFESSEN